MKNFEKLFLHLYAKGIEHYRDSKGTLERIDNILSTPDETLWKELHDAFEQAKRIEVLKRNGIDMTMGEPIEKDIPENIIQELLKESISLEDMKRIINNQLKNRADEHTTNKS